MPLTDVRMANLSRQDTTIPADVTIEDRTVRDIVFSTGQRGLRYDWWTGEQYYEELEISQSAIRTERLEKGLSVIDNHRAYEGIDGVFAITENYRITGGEIVGDCRFATDEESDVKFQKVQDNILRHVSLGYKTHRMMYVGDAEDGIPIYRAVDWEPTDLSFTPVSFETNNGVRSDAGEQPKDSFKCTIETEEENMRLPFMRMQRGGYQEPNNGNSPAPVATPAPAEPQRNEPEPAPQPAPQQRNEPEPAPLDENSIRQQARSFIEAAEQAGENSTHAMEAYMRGDSINQYRAALLQGLGQRSTEQRPNAPIVGTRTDQNEEITSDFATAIEARIRNTGFRDLTDRQRGFAMVSISEACRELERQQGRQTMLGENPLAFAGRMLGVGGNMRAFHTTSDLPLLLENIMNKTLLEAYELETRTFETIARRATANDFRAKNTYKMGDAPDLLPLGEHGEYKYGTFSESKESYRLSTYARKIGFTRQLFINDDLGALSRFPALFADSATRLENDIVWGLILNYDFITNQAANHTFSDNQPLFHSSHRNVVTGQALNLDGLSAVRQLGRNQRSLDNKRMNLTYNTLAVGTQLETTGQRLLTGQYTPDNVDNINIFRNSMNLIVEPRIDDVGATNHYYFSNRVQAIEYAYLAGNEGLYTEVNQSTDIDGTEILARHDFGAGFEDYRGAARGTA